MCIEFYACTFMHSQNECDNSYADKQQHLIICEVSNNVKTTTKQAQKSKVIFSKVFLYTREHLYLCDLVHANQISHIYHKNLNLVYI